MQIIGVGGRSGAGKTFLCHEVARLVAEGTYGLPRLMSFKDNTPDNMHRVAAMLSKSQADEYKMLAEGHARSEIIVLIDDVMFPEQVDMLIRAGATMLFVDATRRLRDLFASWRDRDSEKMAGLYAGGLLPEGMFDWHVTNYHTQDKFLAEIGVAHHFWTGAAVEGA